ncbi:MAG TPA: rhomboid family intramembrane serine protease [Kineosporiaceae bacterium]|nr:rhomboid family intramembrane serine protease [Kineosporiaceae bacterium]
MDCVRAGAKSTRTARTPFGAVASAGNAAPRITQAIIGLCAAAYVLQILPDSNVTNDFRFAPAYATAEPWRLVTSAFLHSPSSPLHILFNMYALWMTGPYLEALLGRIRFAALYLLSAVGGSVGYFLLANPSNVNQWYGGAVGASGAVFGLFGAFFIVQRRLNRDTGPLIAIIAINFVFGFLPGIAWQAHLGGLITGLLTAGVLVYAPKPNRTVMQTAGLVAIVLLLGLAFLVKIVSLPANALY